MNKRDKEYGIDMGEYRNEMRGYEDEVLGGWRKDETRGYRNDAREALPAPPSYTPPRER